MYNTSWQPNTKATNITMNKYQWVNARGVVIFFLGGDFFHLDLKSNQYHHAAVIGDG